MRMSIGVFLILKNCKAPKGSLIWNWFNKLWHVHTHMVYQTNVRNKVKEEFLVIWQNACKIFLNDSFIT